MGNHGNHGRHVTACAALLPLIYVPPLGPEAQMQGSWDGLGFEAVGNHRCFTPHLLLWSRRAGLGQGQM